jgi:hypothetical protein
MESITETREEYFHARLDQRIITTFFEGTTNDVKEEKERVLSLT